MHSARFSPLAAAIAARTAASVSGSTTRSTRVGLSCECRSFTTTPEGWAHAPAQGQAAVKPAIFRNSRRSIMSPPLFAGQTGSDESERQRARNRQALALFEQPVRSDAEQAHRPARGVGALEQRQGARGDLGGIAGGRGRGMAAGDGGEVRV